jgi:hypothetical protein
MRPSSLLSRSRNKATWFSAAALVIALVPGLSSAETLIDNVLGASAGKTKPFACFARIYDAPHMAAHPQQAVTTMTVLASPNPDEPTVLRLRLRATFRARKGVLASEGDCTASDDGKSLHCGVACDGGEMDVTIKDATALLLAVPERARLWKPGVNGGDDVEAHGAFGPDDKLFRLDRAAVDQCLPLADDATERAAMKKAPQ